MSFVAVIENKWTEVTKYEAWDSDQSDGTSKRMNDVRRPTRGIQLKTDSYATLRVVKGDGTAIPMLNGGDTMARDGLGTSDTYSNFMIQAVTEERIEKQQIVETFGESFIFFYGERPRIISIQGVLLNTFDFNWEAEWWKNYELYLRGTKCVESGARIFLTYDQTMISGYIMATGSTKQAVEKNHVPFQFQMFVTDYVQLSGVGVSDANQTGLEPITGMEAAQGRTGMYSGRLSPFRPAAVKKLSMEGGQVGLIGLLGGLVTKIMSATTSAVSGTRAMARNLANMANMPAAYLDMFISNPIRIPMGFAGSLVFDEQPVNLVDAQSRTVDRPVRYTIFGDNEDEFVARSRSVDPKGLSAYYASASMDIGNAFAEPFSEYSNAKWINKVMKKGYEQFRAWGLIPPDNILSNSLQTLAQNPYGMMLLKATRKEVGKVGAKVSTEMNKAIDQVEAKVMPYVAGAQAVLGGIATADRIAYIGGTATGMIDRSGYSVDPPAMQGFGVGQNKGGIGGELAATGPEGVGTPVPSTIAGNFAPPPNSMAWVNGPAGGPIIGVNDLKGVPAGTPPTWTRVSGLPNFLLPPGTNQVVTNPFANPAASLAAFQTIQPTSSTPLKSQIVFMSLP